MNKWLLIAVVLCGWFATSPCICPRCEAGIRASDLPARFLSSGGGLIAPEQLYSSVVHSPQSSLVNSHAIGSKALSLPKVAELSPDDDEQADDSQADDKDIGLTCADLPPCASDWRLSRPDRQHANSFINSKTKPPP